MRRATLALLSILAVGCAVAAGPAFAAGDVSRMAPVIDVQGLIEGDVTLAGGTVTVEAEIAGDLVAAAGALGVGGGTIVKRNAFLFGATVAMGGKYAQRVWVAGDEVTLDIVASGDVSVAATRVIVGPHTRIAGKLKVWSPDPPEIHADAKLGGGLVYDPGDAANAIDALMGFVGTVIRWAFNIAVWVTALLLAALAPGFYNAAATSIGRHPGAVVGWGIGLVFGVPFAVLFAAITVVGLPLAGALILMLGLGLGFGYGIAAGFAGGLALRLVGRDLNAGLFWRLGAVFAGLVAFAAMRHIQGAGPVLLAAAFVFGLGAAARETFQRMR
jgi:hypothetical protein